LPRDEKPAAESTRHFDRKTFEAGPGDRKRVLTYYLHSPATMAPAEAYPLVMVLHGRPGRAYAAEHLVAVGMNEDYPAFVLIPTAPESKAWAVPANDPAYNQFIDRQSLPDAIDILRRIMQENPVDPKRVYIVGCSEGGIGAFAAAAQHPEIFAGAVALSGTWSLGDAPKMTGVPLWIAHGADDPSLPAAKTQALAESIRDHGGSVRYTEIPRMGHYCPDRSLYNRDMWDWLFSQRKD
jgi:predicted peptidase